MDVDNPLCLMRVKEFPIFTNSCWLCFGCGFFRVVVFEFLAALGGGGDIFRGRGRGDLFLGKFRFNLGVFGVSIGGGDSGHLFLFGVKDKFWFGFGFSSGWVFFLGVLL